MKKIGILGFLAIHFPETNPYPDDPASICPFQECKKILEANGAKPGEAPFNPAYLTSEVEGRV